MELSAPNANETNAELPTMTQRAIEESDVQAAPPSKSPLEEVLNPSPAPLLYDADAEQRIPFELEFEGERFEVAYVMGPQTDDALAQYEVLLDKRAFAADDAPERDAMEQSDNSLDAAAWLFDDRAVSAEGFACEGDTLPANWKEDLEAVDKEQVIDSAYLAVAVAPLPPAKPGRKLPLRFRQMETLSVVKLRALFNGHQLDLTHKRTRSLTEKELGFDAMGEFKAIQKRAWVVGGTRLNENEMLIPAKTPMLARLYDRIGYEAIGYKGRVPMHHKARVVQADLSNAQKAVAKKQSDSRT